MLISEFIEQLERMKEQHGDRHVGVLRAQDDSCKPEICEPDLSKHYFSQDEDDYGVTIW